MSAKHRLYLRVGDYVIHRHYEEWGTGEVVEEMTSVLEGGTCLARVNFEDGQQRTFDNNLDSQSCCYFFGVRLHQHPLLAPDGDPDLAFASQKPVKRPTQRRTRTAKRLPRG